MKFSISGRYLDDLGTLIWEDGSVTGDETFLHRFQSSAQNERVVGYVPGPETVGYEAHLASPLSSYMLMCMQFDEVMEEDGELPHFLPCPDGARC